MLHAMRRVPFVIFVIWMFAGCWLNTQPQRPDEPEAPRLQKGATCDEVSDSARAALAVATDKELAKRADPIGIIVLRRCLEDKWSMELRRCVTGAKVDTEVQDCEKLATDEQRKKFEHELEVFAVTEDGQ